MSYSNEDFVAAIERASAFSAIDAKSLQDILRGSAFLRAAKVLMGAVEGKRNAFLAFNFALPESALAATKLQGECIGILRALDMLHELADFPEEEDQKDAA